MPGKRDTKGKRGASNRTNRRGGDFTSQDTDLLNIVVAAHNALNIGGDEERTAALNTAKMRFNNLPKGSRDELIKWVYTNPVDENNMEDVHLKAAKELIPQVPPQELQAGGRRKSRRRKSRRRKSRR